MTEDDEPKLSIEEEIQFRKIKLTLEKNIRFDGIEHHGITKEQELVFLDYVNEFSEQFASRGLIVIHELIGRPDFPVAATLNDDEISSYLIEIMDLLEEHDILLEVLDEYEDHDRLIYEFITKELIWKEVDDYIYEGTSTNFVYEEFYPSDKLDVFNCCIEFINAFFNKKSYLYRHFFSNHPAIRYDFKLWRKSFKKLGVNNLSQIEQYLNEDTATTKFSISYWGILKGTDKKVEYEGEAIFRLSKGPDFWDITSMELPI